MISFFRRLHHKVRFSFIINFFSCNWTYKGTNAAFATVLRWELKHQDMQKQKKKKMQKTKCIMWQMWHWIAVNNKWQICLKNTYFYNTSCKKSSVTLNEAMRQNESSCFLFVFSCLSGDCSERWKIHPLATLLETSCSLTLASCFYLLTRSSWLEVTTLISFPAEGYETVRLPAAFLPSF